MSCRTLIRSDVGVISCILHYSLKWSLASLIKWWLNYAPLSKVTLKSGGYLTLSVSNADACRFLKGSDTPVAFQCPQPWRYEGGPRSVLPSRTPAGRFRHSRLTRSASAKSLSAVRAWRHVKYSLAGRSLRRAHIIASLWQMVTHTMRKNKSLDGRANNQVGHGFSFLSH